MGSMKLTPFEMLALHGDKAVLPSLLSKGVEFHQHHGSVGAKYPYSSLSYTFIFDISSPDKKPFSCDIDRDISQHG